MEPPIQTEYLHSGGAITLIFMEEGARAVISFCMRSLMPGYMVVPPEKKINGRTEKKEERTRGFLSSLPPSFSPFPLSSRLPPER